MEYYNMVSWVAPFLMLEGLLGSRSYFKEAFVDIIKRGRQLNATRREVSYMLSQKCVLKCVCRNVEARAEVWTCVQECGSALCL